MRIFPIIKKVTVVQGGDVPPGAAIMSDSISLFARVNLADQIDAKTDELTASIAALYAENLGAKSDVLTRIDLAGMAETLGAKSDELTAHLAAAYAETLAGKTDDVTFALAALYAESLGAKSETMQAGFSGYADSVAAKGDSLSALVETWANSHTTAGTAPTNPTNAYARNDGALANVKAGGIANGTSTLTLTIPRASVPSGGTRTFRAFYRTNAGVADTFTLTYAQTGGTPATIDLPDGNFLITPHETVLTGLHATNAITVAFTHAVVVIATGGSIDVDAVGIKTEAVF